jgi:NADP-dependent 3-hydroxy acid dehydrogenase YdfG
MTEAPAHRPVVHRPLEDQVAVVTGASRGIGALLALADPGAATVR